jgi:hypothetical protein
MNKNTKAFRSQLAKAKREITVERVFTAPGNRLVIRKWTLPYGVQPRISAENHGKVAGNKGRNSPEKSEMEVQTEIQSNAK